MCVLKVIIWTKYNNKIYKTILKKTTTHYQQEQFQKTTNNFHKKINNINKILINFAKKYKILKV